MTHECGAGSVSGKGHVNCLICGSENPWSFGLSFDIGDSGVVSARFQALPTLQGYDGILHGGVICGLLDAAMTHCLFGQGVKAVTADLHVRFLKPVPCEALVEVKARVISARPPLYRVAAELIHENEVAASAKAKFMPRRRGANVSEVESGLRLKPSSL
jgi:acyl-coenzyme A thioesterase PaaI-like protein